MALLEVRGLVKYYGRRCVVQGVDFDVNLGEVVGLLGPNGAGKTTSFRMTTGQISPNQGGVTFNGQDVTSLPMYRRARLGMGYLSQEPSVFKKLTVEQNILGILEMLPKARTLGRAFTRSERYDRMEKVIHQFGLAKVRKNLGARLSGGEKRRLEIARCLVCEPLLVLLDEPFAAVDPMTKADIRQVVREMADSGIGVLLTDHDVREVLKITTRSYLIKDGKVRTHGTPTEIVHDPIAIQEYLGEDFHNNTLAGQERPNWPAYAPTTPAIPATPTPASAPAEPTTLEFQRPVPRSLSASQRVLEQEQIQQWIEALKGEQQGQAVVELSKKGMVAVPLLLAALDRRDAEFRHLVAQMIEHLCDRSINYDAFAPEAIRKQQLAVLRDQLERKAG